MFNVEQIEALPELYYGRPEIQLTPVERNARAEAFFRNTGAERLLRGLVCPPVLYADHFEARGVDLFKAARDHDLEGIVAKLAAGRYDPAATTWVKIKNRAYSQAEGRADFIAVTRTRTKAGLSPFRPVAPYSDLAL